MDTVQSQIHVDNSIKTVRKLTVNFDQTGKCVNNVKNYYLFWKMTFLDT